MKNNQIELQITDQSEYIPDISLFQRWIDTVLIDVQGRTEMVIRIVSVAESAELNVRFRHKNGPTNVLSFPADIPAYIELPLLGDVVICASIVALQAVEQNKHLNDHWAHIVIHGALHLLGYDHIKEDEAEIMETKEIEVLKHLDISNPYLEVLD